MKYAVIATSFPVGSEGNAESPVRCEIVGTDDPLFSKCRDAKDIEDAYHAFWNDLPSKLTEQVVVLKVVEVK